MAIFPEWELASDFLNYSINTIGHQPEFHQKPGAYGTIPHSLSNNLNQLFEGEQNKSSPFFFFL